MCSRGSNVPQKVRNSPSFTLLLICLVGFFWLLIFASCMALEAGSGKTVSVELNIVGFQFFDFQ